MQREGAFAALHKVTVMSVEDFLKHSFSWSNSAPQLCIEPFGGVKIRTSRFPLDASPAPRPGGYSLEFFGS